MRKLLLIVVLGLVNPIVLANEDLDAELDAEWGHKQIQATKSESPKDQYAAKLKMLEAGRDAEIARCRATAGGNAYCSNYAEENFRRDKRALDQKYEGYTDDGEFNRRKNVGFN
jgi:hypothetical protein